MSPERRFENRRAHESKASQLDLGDERKIIARIVVMPRTKKKASKQKRSLRVARSSFRRSTKQAAGSRKRETRNEKRTSVPAIYTKQKRSLHLGMHFFIAGSAIAVLLGLAFFERGTFATNPSSAKEQSPMTIGLEYASPLSLSVLLARKEGAGYVSITNQSNDEIHVSVPSEWKRTEVTGAAIEKIKPDIPVFGFTRWNLPALAGMKMLLPEVPSGILFDSVSEAVAAVDLKTIDLTTNSVSSKVVLLQKQTYVPLWGTEE